MTPMEQFRLQVLRLAEDWAKYRVFDWQPEIPWTNNFTEQAIGRMKMRARQSVDIRQKQACSMACYGVPLQFLDMLTEHG